MLVNVDWPALVQRFLRAYAASRNEKLNVNGLLYVSEHSLDNLPFVT